MNIEVYSSTGLEWEAALKHLPQHNSDIFYLPEWYKTWIEHENASPYCIHIEMEGFHFLYPFFKKKIINYDLDGDYFDIQSTYGYGGVIVSDNNIPKTIEFKVNQRIDEWLIENNIVAEFIRENPLLNHFQRTATYSVVRKNVYIPTNIEYKIPDKQARQNVSKAISLGAKIIYDTKMDHLEMFIQLYNMTVEHRKMHPYYQFDNIYFGNVKTYLAKYSTLIHVIYNDTIISSALYFKYYDKATLHLVGSNNFYQHIRANDLLYKAAIQLSIDNGSTILCVGGGTSNNPVDSLFKFKSKYGNIIKDVRIGRNVVNHSVFNLIIKQWELRYPHLQHLYSTYFLKYRQEV